jgi:hypothetical protein
MLSKLFGRNHVQRLEDHMWLNLEQKYRGIARGAVASTRASALAVIVAHFSDSFSSMQTALELLNIPHAAYRSAIGGQQLVTTCKGAVLLVMADSLVSDGGDSPSSDGGVDMTVMEHHPLLPDDERIVRFAETLRCPVRLGFHASLDDPLLTLFNGESVRKLLRALEIPDNEPLTHTLISQSIQSAQRRIEQKAHSNQPALSAAQWLETNM